jgi:hypothetical protein
MAGARVKGQVARGKENFHPILLDPMTLYLMTPESSNPLNREPVEKDHK